MICSSLKGVSKILVDSNEMLHFMGLHCFPKYLFMGKFKVQVILASLNSRKPGLSLKFSVIQLVKS